MGQIRQGNGIRGMGHDLNCRKCLYSVYNKTHPMVRLQDTYGINWIVGTLEAELLKSFRLDRCHCVVCVNSNRIEGVQVKWVMFSVGFSGRTRCVALRLTLTLSLTHANCDIITSRCLVIWLKPNTIRRICVSRIWPCLHSYDRSLALAVNNYPALANPTPEVKPEP